MQVVIGLILTASLAPWIPAEDPALQGLQGHPRLHVVVLGSSTAAGVGPAEPENAWVARYTRFLTAQFPDARVTNLSRSGNTSYHINPTGFPHPPDRPAPDQERNINMAIALNPTAIIINLPGNDVALGYALSERFANFGRVIALAAEAGIPVWVTTPQPRNLDDQGRDQLRMATDTTFARYGSYAIDFWTGLADADGRIRDQFDSGDGVHLNDVAHQVLAERVIETVDLGETVTVDPSDLPEDRSGPNQLFDPRSVSVYPNPTGSSSITMIEFESECDCETHVWISDQSGRLLSNVFRGHTTSGENSVRWIPKTSNGRRLPAGLYFVVVEGGGRIAVGTLAVAP